MSDEFDVMLDQALDKCLAGSSIDEVISEYDEDIAEQLRMDLEVAMGFNNIEVPKPSGRALFTAIAELDRISKIQNKKIIKFPTLMRRIAAVLIISVTGIFGLNAMASSSVPGDFLYGFKRLSEKVHYTFTATNEGQVLLQMVFSEKRLAEALAMNQKGELPDTKFIQQMLSEVDRSVVEVLNFDEGQRGAVLSRARELNKRQRDVLNHIVQGESDKVKEEIKPLIDTCDCREKWFTQLYNEAKHDKSMGCEDDCTCCSPSEASITKQLSLYPEIIK